MRWDIIACVAAFALLAGLLIASGGHERADNSSHERLLVREHFDTARCTVYVALPPLRIAARANSTRPITLHDTLYRESCLDTLLRADSFARGPDTLSVCYAHDLFRVALRLAERKREVLVPYFARDSSYSRADTVRVSERQPWWQETLTIATAIAAGLLLGRFIALL